MSSTLFKSSILLTGVQATNILIPMLVLPLLSRRLPIEVFGHITIILAFITLSLIITDFGFSVLGANLIAKKKTDNDFISKYVNCSVFIKLSITIILCVIFFGVVTFKFTNVMTYGLAVAVCFSLVFQSLQINWFFQGIEKMQFILVVTLISKIVFLLFSYFLVNDANDLTLFFVGLAISNALACIFTIYFVVQEGVKWTFVSLNDMKSIFIEVLPFFFSRCAVAFFSTTSTLWVGAFSGPIQAATFAVCLKVYQAGQALTNPISQAIYPRVSATGNYDIIFKVLSYTLVPFALGCFVLGINSEFVMRFVFGVEFEGVNEVLILLLITSVVNYISVNLGYPLFSGINRIEFANYTVYFGGVVQLFCLFCLVFLESLNAVYMAASILIVEVAVLFSRCVVFLILSKRVVR